MIPQDKGIVQVAEELQSRELEWNAWPWQPAQYKSINLTY